MATTASEIKRVWRKFSRRLKHDYDAITFFFQMASTPTFVYMDELSIDDEFKCSICNEPFENATSTPCDHTFCRRCIEQWLEKTSDNGSCPTCRESVSLDSDLKPANRIISNRIDRYPVKCLTCGLEGIQRGLFSNHTEKSCTKVDVSCSACDIWCPWIGPRNQLNDHLQSCSYSCKKNG